MLVMSEGLCGFGFGVNSYLGEGEGRLSERTCIASYDLDRASSELEKLLLRNAGGTDVYIRLFRLCAINSGEVNIGIEDLSDFEFTDSLSLNDLSQRVVEECLGDDIEGYVCKDGAVAYQTWSDGELGDEGCLSEPDDEEWRFEPNEAALVTLFSGVHARHDVSGSQEGSH